MGPHTGLPPLRLICRRRLPLILQGEAAECGLACLAMVAGFFGYRTDLLTLRQRFAISLKGSTLQNLIDIGAVLHLAARALRVDLDELGNLHIPCILHWDLNHFVVLQRVLPHGRGVLLHDPARGAVRMPLAEVSKHFTGIALELTPTPQFTRQEARQRVRLRDMMGQVVGLQRSLAQILLLALALEVFALGPPVFMQMVIDGAILTGDHELLTLLVVGWGLLMLVHTGIGVLRSWMVLYMATHLNLQWLANVFTHLMRLPVQYFAKRHLGDVVSRFRAIDQIQQTLTTSMVEAILDGLMAVATLGMMLAYSGTLSGVVLASLVCYGLVRWAVYAPLRRAHEEHLVLAAREQTLFLESLRGVQSIKLFNYEDHRRARWLNAVVDATNRSIATQKIRLGFTTARTCLGGMENLLIVWLGARLVMENAFSVGMLLAFISYKTNFAGRMSALIDKAIEVNMLSLHVDRLADIVLSAPETPPAVPRAQESVLVQGPCSLTDTTIAVQHLGFRYAESEPWVFKDLELTVHPGEYVAIVGPSGCGKTTLVKILLGLLPPTTGEVLVGGIPLERLGVRHYRALVGAVMQDDHLFVGSILDNISFCDPQVDPTWAEACATQACIHDEITAMPMGYQTLIGDMGTTLSGGQKQRVLLARALYKRPHIVLLDEATSHLDVANEQHVSAALARLHITRVVIAHRPETVRAAERVIMLGGQVIPGSDTSGR
jgi:ATP-binding cassette subfamily B protein RaxB